MKTQIRKFQFQPILLIVVAALSLCATAPAQQSAPTPGHSSPSSIPQWCSDMMKMHDEFLKMVKTQDTELASQVEKMKNTPLDQKAPHIVETNPRLLPSLENKSLPTDQATPLSNAGWLFFDKPYTKRTSSFGSGHAKTISFLVTGCGKRSALACNPRRFTGLLFAPYFLSPMIGCPASAS